MVVFEDGFESGDFTAWTGTNGSPTVQNTVKYYGIYAMQVTAQNEYARAAVADSDTLYFRTLFRMESLPTGAEYLNIMRVTSNVWNEVLMIQVRDGVLGYVSGYPPGGGNVAVAWVVDTWYSIKAKFIRNNGAGEYRVYLDGVEVIADAGLDTSGIPAGHYCMVGNYSLVGGVFTVQHDCVVIDTADIAELPPPISSAALKPGWWPL